MCCWEFVVPIWGRPVFDDALPHIDLLLWRTMRVSRTNPDGSFLPTHSRGNIRFVRYHSRVKFRMPRQLHRSRTSSGYGRMYAWLFDTFRDWHFFLTSPSFPSHSTGRQCSILENSLKQKPISHLWVTQLSHGWILPVNGANLLEYWRQDGIHPWRRLASHPCHVLQKVCPSDSMRGD